VVSHGRLKKLNVDIVVGKDCTYFVFGFSKNFVAPSYLLLLAWTTRLRNAFCLLHALKATQPALPHARREIKVGRLVSEDFTTSPRTFLKKVRGCVCFVFTSSRSHGGYRFAELPHAHGIKIKYYERNLGSCGFPKWANTLLGKGIKKLPSGSFLYLGETATLLKAEEWCPMED